MQKNIVIIGAGAIGNALARLVQEGGATVFMFDADVSKVPDQKPLAETVPGAQLIFCCTPSWVLRSVLSDIKPLVAPEAIVVTLAKGIEEGSRATVDEILRSSLPKGQRFALLGGAMLAKEIDQGMVSVGVVGTEKPEVFDALVSLFSHSHLYLEHSTDVHGVAIASVLKNIYATAFGIADGLGWSSNIKGWLTAEAIKEMLFIGPLIGAKRETILNLAGLGDLVATGFSPYSNNRTMGEQLIATGTIGTKREGVIALPSVLAMLGDQAKGLFLLNALAEILVNHTMAKKIFEDFLNTNQIVGTE